jgi:hypothetical protein
MRNCSVLPLLIHFDRFRETYRAGMRNRVNHLTYVTRSQENDNGSQEATCGREGAAVEVLTHENASLREELAVLRALRVWSWSKMRGIASVRSKMSTQSC